MFFSIFILLVVSFPSVFSQPAPFDVGKSYSWLVGQSKNGNYGDDIMTTAFATLALRNSGVKDYADLGYQWIKSQEDTTNHCWPKSGCKVQDTAFALWVMNEYADDEGTAAETWLEQSLSAGLTGKWLLQAVTTNSGSCKISYTKKSENIEKSVKVEAGVFPDCSNSPNTLFDLNSCLESGLLANNPGIAIDVNCNDLGPSTVISVVYNKDTSYYLIQEATTTRQLVKIENGCFGTSTKGSCSLEPTLYSNWILFNTASTLKTFLWLRDNYDKLNAMHDALLYLSTDDKIKEMFLGDLKKAQRNDGSFDKSVITTAYAALALQKAGSTDELGKAVDWLEKKQGSDGSFESSLLKTAVILYAGLPASNEVVVVPPSGIPPSDQGGKPTNDVCNHDGICDVAFGEDTENCASDCSCGDGKCDGSESSTSCPKDCQQAQGSSCGNDIKESGEECDGRDDSSCLGLCLADCTCGQQAKKASFGWVIWLLGIVVIGGAIFFFVKKRGSKKTTATRKQESGFFQAPYPYKAESPKQMPRYESRAEPKSKIEDELEKSLEEAKKLLKKI